jgi:hypothetical protein
MTPTTPTTQAGAGEGGGDRDIAVDGRASRAPVSGDLGRRYAVIGSLAAIGTLWAWFERWTCDDAWISFRYARNLVRGHGLVFNVGEWVEGYTNFAWTLFIAAGLATGLEPDAVAHAGSLASHAGILVLLGVWELRWRDRARGSGAAATFFDELPLAPIFWIASPDARDWATGGLETAAFTCLMLASLVWTTGGAVREPRRAAAVGLSFALLAMLRPDGVLVGGLAGAWILSFARRRLACGAAMALGFFALWLPFEGWRVWAYGDLVPNTYYAKSAYASWWSQGGRYVVMFAERYGLLIVLGLIAIALALRPRRRVEGDRGASEELPELGLLLAAAVLYSLYVAKVGGDFMYARLLMPTLPLWCLLAAHATRLVAQRSRLMATSAFTLALLWMVVTPSPTGGYRATRHGVTDERTYYQPLAVAYLDAHAAWIRGCTRGVDASFVIMGGFAREAYVADMPIVVEAETGLTDATIAKQVLTTRGRVGHEKLAPAGYLVDERAVDLTFDPRVYGELGLAAHLPEVRITCAGVKGHLLRWEPTLVAGLRGNGVGVPDYPARLDRVIDRLSAATDEQRRGEWRRVERFYFRWVDDPARRARFEGHLEPASGERP